MEKEIKVISWIAVSSKAQAELESLNEQRTENRRHANRHGWTIVAELEVPGHTRDYVLFEEAARDIPAYQQYKRLLDTGEIRAVLCTKLDRLGRTAALIMAMAELCRRAGAVLYETENPPPNIDGKITFDQLLMGSIRSAGGQWELEELKRRNTFGVIGRVKRGKMPPGPIPYGYSARYDERREQHIEIVEHEAVIVRRIFEKYVNGAGGNSIAEGLNGGGVPSPTGKPWTGDLVRHIIKRVWRYAGYSEVNRRTKTGRQYVRAKGNWESIISEQMADRVLQEGEDRGTHRRLPDTPILLSGVVRCVRCGTRMAANTKRGKKGQRFVSYCCRRKHPGRCITSVRIEAALRKAMEVLRDVDLGSAEIEEEDTVALIEERISQHTVSAERLREALFRADDAYTAGHLDAERYGRQIDRIQGQIAAELETIEQLQNALNNERQKDTRRERLMEIADRGLEMLDNPNIPEANAWLRRRVTVWILDYQVHSVEWK